jgi:hypothetical protein
MKGNDKTNEDTTGPSRIASISHSFLLLGFKCRFVRKSVLTEKRCSCIRIMSGRLSPSLFLSWDFKNFSELKVRSSSTDPSTKVHPIWANFKYSGIMFVSTCEDFTISHSQVKGFFVKGGSMHPPDWLFIVILNSDCWISNAEEDSSSPTLSSVRSPEVLPRCTLGPQN